MKEIIVSTLFIWFKKKFDLNTEQEKTWEIISLILLSLNEDNFFFKLKKIFLWDTLRTLRKNIWIKENNLFKRLLFIKQKIYLNEITFD